MRTFRLAPARRLPSAWRWCCSPSCQHSGPSTGSGRAAGGTSRGNSVTARHSTRWLSRSAPVWLLLLSACSQPQEQTATCTPSGVLNPVHLGGFSANLPEGCWIKGDQQPALVMWGQQREPGPQPGSWEETAVARMQIPDASDPEFAKAMGVWAKLSPADRVAFEDSIFYDKSKKLAEEEEQTVNQGLSLTRFTVTENPIKVHEAAGAHCMLYSTWVSDRRVPFEVGRLFKICEEDYICFSSQSSGEFVHLHYSERAPTEQINDDQCRARAGSFFSSLVFQ